MISRSRKAKYDWQTILLEYITSPAGEGEVTLESLARKYGKGAKGALKRMEERSRREGWVRMREQHRRNTVEKAGRKAEETAAQRLHRHAQYLKLVQAKAVKAMIDELDIPSPRDGIEAVKAERILYDQPSEHVSHEFTDRGGLGSNLFSSL